MQDDDWAIVIGINQYPKLSGVSPLRGAVDDAWRFHKWLTEPQGGDVPPNHIATLIQDASPGANLEEPKRSQLGMYVENNFLPILPHRPFGRRLYLYFSGHGISPTGQESIRNAALLMANAVMPTPLLHVPGNILAEGMRSSAYFEEVILIMDCCRDFQKNVIPSSFDFIDPMDIGKICTLFEAYATTWASKARELPIPPTNEVHGVFTHSLLEVLKAGKMTGTVLKRSVERHLAWVLKDQKKAQEPMIGPNENLAQIVFNESAGPPRTPVTIKGLAAGAPMIESKPEGSGASLPVPLTDWSLNNGVWSGTLEPRTYELRLPAGGGILFNVSAAVPEEVQV